MTTKKTYILRGTLTAIEPLATASKELVDEGKKIYGANSPVPVPSFHTQEGTHLYFPATGLRGTLRRALRDVVRQNLIKRGSEGLLIDEHYLLTLGGIKGAGAEDRSSVKQEEEWRTRNVLLSLFGAGDAGFLSFVQGKTSIANAICSASIKPMAITGARTNDLFANREGLDFLADSEIDNLVARAAGNAKASAIRKEIGLKTAALQKAKRAGDDDTDALTQDIEKLNASLDKTLKDSKASSVSVGMPLAGFQAIPPYSIMDHTIKIFNATAEELGGMIAALNQFSLNPTIGAHRAVGCGEVKAQYTMFEVTATGSHPIASIAVGGYMPMEVSNQTDSFDSAVNAFNAYLESDDFDLSVPYAL